MRKKVLFLASAIVLGLSFNEAKSQHIPFRKYCATDSMTAAAMRQYPEYAKGRKEFEAMVRSLNTQSNARRASTPNSTIPVVVHVIHTYGADNITDGQVYDALRIVNEDYSKTNPDTASVIAAYQPRYANVGFEFKLAQKDPNGNCTNGITRTYSTLTDNADNNVKSLIMWDPTKYLNIWVVNRISFGAGGYSYLPCSVPQNIEGIVVLNTQFGSIGKSNGGNFSARTLTHEIGHYMGLPHVWGGSNSPGDPANCGMDDGIADTPNTIGSATQNCLVNANTCGGTNGNPDPDGTMPDNVQNYMDYSNCAMMFTNGQKAVMTAALSMSCRSNLTTPNNLIATGTNPGYTAACAPIADFKASADRVCEGNVVYFNDQSYNIAANSAVSYSWSFPGGTPATSTDPDPMVTYNIPGDYDVVLTTTNAAGTHTITRNQAVRVSPATSIAIAPYQNSFEDPSFPVDPLNAQLSWELIRSGTISWEQTQAAAATGSSSLRMRNRDVSVGTVNTLIMPAVNFNNITGSTLKFKVAYAQRAAVTNDKLSVYFSKDCGRTWALRYNKIGANLSTTGTFLNNFTPNAAQWRQETVALGNYATANTLIKFEITSNSGSSLYLDDIEITGNAISGLEDAQANALNLNVYPNPSNGDATVGFALTGKSDYTLEVLSITGQRIGQALVKQNQEGSQQLKLSSITGQVTLKAGVYLVKLQANGFTTLKKAIVF
ncbi:M43 family zinc metalloprotease [Adhaeribacter soli]|uniref:T9SS type A sorting domain-containing protein n=1 Tax=Adhaeribacter soli TaxID=2607655 RepID=A0A5N1IHT9_9BACT|nr:M43 family zinc metalloprotease [Adhaeribacter soli]KAA9325202.1 T9SS type A sorting domain-containing protein [Adhaeribacter soli]